MKIKNYTISEIIRDPWQHLFLMLGVFTLAIFIPFTMAAMNFVEISLKNKPKDYKFPLFEDLWVTALIAAIFYIVENTIKYSMYVFIIPICRE